jgi:hypothetical protein
VDPVPDPVLLRKSGSAGNGTRTSGSVARNYDHYTTEQIPNVIVLLQYNGDHRMLFSICAAHRYLNMRSVF